MKVTVLGCGGAGGVPMISLGWGRCDPADPRNRRRRPSVLVEQAGQTILIDSGPDLREQLLAAEVRHLDAVLYTHAHADHTHGIDDLREVNRAMNRALPVYGEKATLDEIDERFGYAFAPLAEGSQSIYKPLLVRHEITAGAPFTVGRLTVIPFDQDHRYCRSTGYRIGDFAYSTDVWDIPEPSFGHLEGLELWIVGCFAAKPHPTHAHVEKVIAWAERVRPKRCLLTHLGPGLDYAELSATLPPGLAPAFDGQVIRL